MRNIRITAEAYDVVRKAARFEFESTGRQVSNGDWLVPMQTDTVKRLEANALAGETISDTIIRVVTMANAKGRLQ